MDSQGLLTVVEEFLVRADEAMLESDRHGEQGRRDREFVSLGESKGWRRAATVIYSHVLAERSKEAKYVQDN